MGYTDLGAVTSSAVISKAYGDQVDLNFKALKTRVIPVINKVLGGAVLADTYITGHYIDLIGSSIAQGAITYELFVPSDYGSLSKAVLRTHNSVGAGNLQYEIKSYWGIPGGSPVAGGSSYTASAPVAIASGIITEINVASILSGMPANASLALSFIRYASSTADTLDNTFGVFSPYFEYLPAS